MSSTASSRQSSSPLRLQGGHRPEFDTILTDDALECVAGLVELFSPRIKGILEAGIRQQQKFDNISVSLGHLQAWLHGRGAVPLHRLMEDVATAEISRTRLWQWVHSPEGVPADGRKVTAELFHKVLEWEIHRPRLLIGEEDFARGGYADAAGLLERVVVAEVLPEFMTSEAYPAPG